MKKSTALIRSLCWVCAILASVTVLSSCKGDTTDPVDTPDTPALIGETVDGVLTVYVSPNGSGTANGTKEAPYSTIEAARDALRTLDKANLCGIDVVISGVHYITETLEFTSEDAGSESCPIRYIGEDGATINGGTSFDYTEFEKASGDTLALFPEEVRDKLYMYDLGKLGYTSNDIAEMLKDSRYYNKIGLISVNGKQMDLARYPNADEGWIEIESGYFLDQYGNYTENDGNNGGDDAAVETIIEYGEEHFERVISWKNREDLFMRGHFTFVWCRDDNEVTTVFEDKDEIIVKFSGGYFPKEGGLLFFYNIPEELDVPGEYYVDHNAILYYYPEDDFETAHFTVSLIDDDIIRMSGADWLTLEGLIIESSHKNGISFNANNITIKNCTVTDIYSDGIVGSGSNVTVEGNKVSNTGECGINVSGGDETTLTTANNVICNNKVENWATRNVMEHGIRVSGCGTAICHNELTNAPDRALNITGPMHTIEYNYISDTCLFYCDEGTLRTHGYAFGTVVRYNVVLNTGYESSLDIVGVQGIIVDGSSGVTVYGNIVYNSTGSSLAIAGGVTGGRSNTFYNNLCIKPGRVGFDATCPTLGTDVSNGVAVTHNDIPEYLLSDIWQSTYPELAGLHDTFDPDNYANDPTYLYSPAYNKVYDNYLIMDKGYNTWLDYQQGYVGKTTSVESHFNTFSEIEEFSDANGNLYYYNSKRNKNPMTISEAIIKASEAVGEIMTPEQLSEVGLIGAEYGIGDILIQ